MNSTNKVLERLLREDMSAWDALCEQYQERNQKLRVPLQNTIETLHQFNRELSDLYTEVCYYYAKAKRNKDAIERLIESVLKDFWGGKNPEQRKAGGYQVCRKYPAPEWYHESFVNLFDLEDRLNGFYLDMDATIWSLKGKMESKITNNSLLRIESQLA